MIDKMRDKLLRDVFLLFTGTKLLRTIGIQPTSFWGGSTIGFFAGNMAGVYGFDARQTLTEIEKATK